MFTRQQNAGAAITRTGVQVSKTAVKFMVCLPAALFVLGGCATTGHVLQTETSDKQRAEVKVTDVAGGPRATQEWQAAAADADKECSAQAAKYEELTQEARQRGMSLATVGYIVSAIVAPSVAAREGVGKATAAAAGGLAGASGALLAANEKTGNSPLAMSTAFNNFRTELLTQTEFLTKPPESLDVELGKLRSLKLWCAANAPNAAAAEMKFMQDQQKLMRDLISTQQEILTQYRSMNETLLKQNNQLLQKVK